MIGDRVEEYYSVQWRNDQDDTGDYWSTIGKVGYNSFLAAYDYGVAFCDRLIDAMPELPLSMRVLRTQVTISREIEYTPKNGQDSSTID